jgi:ABC-2 type transport system permease protein
VIRLIAIRTFLQNIYDYRFTLTLALVLGFVTVTAFLSVGQTTERHRAYQRLHRLAAETANLESVRIVRRPASLSFLYDGGEDDLPRYLIVTDDFVDLPIEEVSARVLTEPFVRMDWVFITISFYGLLALLLTFDLISGQRENRTLALILAQPVSRSDLLLGSYLGTMLTLVPALGIGMMIYLVVARVEGLWSGSSEDWVRVMLVFVLSAVFISAMVLLGLFASAAFERSSTALMAAFVFWMLMTLVIPSAHRLCAPLLVPAPSFRELQRRIGTARAEYKSSLAPLWSMDIARIVRDPNKTPAQRERKLAEYQAEILEKNRRAISRYKSELRRLRAEYLNRHERRAQVIDRLDLFSPPAAYRRAVEAIIGTGRTHLAAFTQAAEQYMRAYTAFVLRARRELEERADWRGFIVEESGYRVRSVSWLDYRRVEFDRRSLPLFEDPGVPLRHGLAFGAAAFCALILFTLGLFLIALRAVHRARVTPL